MAEIVLNNGEVVLIDDEDPVKNRTIVARPIAIVDGQCVFDVGPMHPAPGDTITIDFSAFIKEAPPLQFSLATHMALGDEFTMQGSFKHRSLWQWLTRQPKQLKLYSVTDVYSSNNSTIEDR